VKIAPVAEAGGTRMTPTERIAILLPLVAGAGAVIGTIFIHALALNATLNFLRRERRLGRTGITFWRALISAALNANVIGFLKCEDPVEFPRSGK